MIDTWDESVLFDEMEETDDDFVSYSTSLSHADIEASGEPTRPLEFPTPVVYDGLIVELTASDHRTGVEYELKNVLVRRRDAETAYLIKKKLAKTSYGWVKLGVVLRKVRDEEGKSKWLSTGDFVAVKCSSWAKIQAMRGRHLVDPIKEISVLQLIGNNESKENHVLGCIEVLQSDEFLYTVMPYCSGGELYEKLDITGLQIVPDEEQARTYFQQLLKALVFLHRKGICHRNICLENLLLDADDNLVLLDSGLSLRVPYNDPSNIDGVTDVSEGSTRRMMRPQGQCGQLMYMAPEVLNQTPFDGHATDLWASAITLFIMLVGVAPFGMAQCSDLRFEKISKQGNLKELLKTLEVSLSREAIDLLQNMLWLDPRDRYTLADVMAHPWVHGESFPEEEVEESYPEEQVACLRRRETLQREEAPLDAPESPTSTIVRSETEPVTEPKRKSMFDSLKLMMPKARRGSGATQSKNFKGPWGGRSKSLTECDRSIVTASTIDL